MMKTKRSKKITILAKLRLKHKKHICAKYKIRQCLRYVLATGDRTPQEQLKTTINSNPLTGCESGKHTHPVFQSQSGAQN